MKTMRFALRCVILIVAIGVFELNHPINVLGGEVKSWQCPFCLRQIPVGGECTCPGWRAYHKKTATSSGLKQAPAVDWDAIQRRQEEERRRREEEKRRRQLKEASERVNQRAKELREKFGLEKEELLDNLKSGDSTASGGSGSTDLILKEPLFSKGHKGSAPPYLAGLNPKWPIVVNPARVQGGTPHALRTANRRTHWLLKSLEMGHQNWEISIMYLVNQLTKHPEDEDLRHALRYLRGLYIGYLSSKNVGDNYYKYGVRKWVEGDYDGAARAFAVAVRENPDDVSAYRTYAYMLGLRRGSGLHLTANSHYSSIDIPDKKIMEQEVMKKLKELRLAASLDPQNLKLRAGLNYYEGMTAYYDYKAGPALGHRPTKMDEKSSKLFDEGLKNLLDHDYEGAVRTFSKVGKDSMDDQMLLFTKWYAAGRAGARSGDGGYEPWDPRMNQVFSKLTRESLQDAWPLLRESYWNYQRRPAKGALGKLKEQLMDVVRRNPFFGALSEEQERKLHM